MSIEIRNPRRPEELRGGGRACMTTSLPRASGCRARDRSRSGRTGPPERTWVAWDGARACGTFRSWATELTLPGGATLPAAAVSAVTVLPTHRRRGILTRHGRGGPRVGSSRAGEPLAILIASEYPIYGRFGYGPATRDARLTVDEPARATVRGERRRDRVELAPPTRPRAMRSGRVYDAGAPAPGRARSGVATSPGTSTSGLSRRRVRGQAWNGLRRPPSRSCGCGGRLRPLQRRGQLGRRRPRGTSSRSMTSTRSTDAAYADLWRFLVSVDLVATVRQATAARRAAAVAARPTPGRVDRRTSGTGCGSACSTLPRALEARTYERAGSLVLEVVDDEAWSGTRRWRLDAMRTGRRAR